MTEDFRAPKGKFSLGKVVTTAGVHKEIDHYAIFEVLDRHANCDWGDICDEDKKSNLAALDFEERLVSAYMVSDKERNESKVYVITEWDRSVTTVLFPSEY